MAHWKEAMGKSRGCFQGLAKASSTNVCFVFFAEGKPNLWRPGQIYTGELNKTME
jgi:hypothetical protein